ncbi:MAG: type II secretion system F family protein [Pseudomonadota bacterium]
MSSDLSVYILAGLAFLVIAAIGLAFTGGGSEKAAKRARQLASNERQGGARRAQDAEQAKRNRQTQQMLDQLRQQGAEQKSSVLPTDVKSLLDRAGLDISVSMFWVISAVCGVAGIAIMLYTGAGVEGTTIQGIIIPGPVIAGGAGVAGFLGFPRWVLGMLASRRNKKLGSQFADAIDVIVRGVKSGLPLTECLRIIAKESPAPLGPEFGALTDNISMGTTMERALQKFYSRVPLPEVNFFVIVLTIQSKSGGNLSEALGNLSGIIRSRKMMKEKIKAMSSEAKASAGIIASLPFAVAGMVYMTTPDYISQLWETSTGHFILAIGCSLMFVGVMTMRRMINFEI